MDVYEMLTDPWLEVLRRGLVPIAGGAGEGEEGGGDDAGGDGTDGGAADEQAGGEEGQQQGQQDGQAQGGAVAGQQNGGAVAQGGAPGDQLGAQGGGMRQTRAPDRIRELSERNRELEIENRLHRERFGTGQQQQQNGRQPERREPVTWSKLKGAPGFEEMHTHLAPYMDHFLPQFLQSHLEPMQQELGVSRMWQEWYEDRSNFYESHPELLQGERASERREAIEDATRALSRNMGRQVAREDVWRYLRGHEKHGALFADEAQQQTAQLDNGVVAARRGASPVGVRTPAARPGQRGTPDLSTMTTAQRVAYYEREHGNKPF